MDPDNGSNDAGFILFRLGFGVVASVGAYILVKYFFDLAPFSSSVAASGPSPGSSPASSPTPTPKLDQPTTPPFDGEDLRECIIEAWCEIEDKDKTGKEVVDILMDRYPGINTVHFLPPIELTLPTIVPNRVSIFNEDGTPKTTIVDVTHG